MTDQSTGGSSEEQESQLLDIGAPARPSSCPGRPELIGAPFSGVAKSATEPRADLTMNVMLQTSTGDLGGTFQLKPARSGAVRLFRFQGAVNREGLFVLHGRADGDRLAVISGNAQQQGHELIGNFVLKEPGLPLNAGTFNATRT